MAQNLKRVHCKIVFKERQEKQPRITILEPKTAEVTCVTEESFQTSFDLDPKQGGYVITVVYRMGLEEPINVLITVQFCPGCREVIEKWISFVPAVMGPNNQIAPAVPVSICPFCGGLFVAKKVLEGIKMQKERPTILSPHGGFVR